MAWGTILAGIAILGMAVSWYGFQLVALRDLHIRSRVRSGNRVVWALGILCVPYVGALAYMVWGAATSAADQPGPTRRPVVAAHPLAANDMPRHQKSREPRSIPAPMVPWRQISPPGRPTALTRPVAPPVSLDPVIGTDMSELLQRRSGITPLPGAGDTVIRWPGSTIPDAAPLDLRH